ncbi:MAG: rRNA maturation RNase YbeY [Phycisphaerales bacterium]|nr:rRNA maturation RNase YbeY [Phycisphaerales bacterium]
MQKFNFYNETNKNKILKNKKLIVLTISKIFQDHKKTVEQINFIFTDDKSLKAINVKYLNHNYNTDVITFDLSETDKVFAEVYISVDTVYKNAKIYKTFFNTEIARVIFHACLHLVGYQDKTTSQKKNMVFQENLYLDFWNRQVN